MNQFFASTSCTVCAAGLVGVLAACSAAPPSAVAPQHPRLTKFDVGAPVVRPLTPIDDTARASAACHEAALGVHEWLKGADELGWPLEPGLLDDGARLPRVSGAVLDEPAPLVHLRASDQAFDGLRTSDLSTLGERLADSLEARRRAIEPSPFLAAPRAYFAIDSDVPWARVIEAVTRAAAAGYERASFVFVDPGKSAAPTPPSRLDEELAKVNLAGPVRRQQILAEALAFVYKDCQSALELVAQFGSEIPEVQDALVEELPSAIEACGCSVDVPSVQALHATLFANRRPGAVFTVNIGTSRSSSVTLKARADAPWSDTYGLVVGAGPTAERVTLEIDVPPPPLEVKVEATTDAKGERRSKPRDRKKKK